MSLNLFDIPNIDYRYEAKRWIPFKPANTGTRPILFTVPSGDDYYDLNETKLEIKVRLNTAGTEGISSGEGAPSDANNSKYVYCVNNFGHSLLPVFVVRRTKTFPLNPPFKELRRVLKKNLTKHHKELKKEL